MFYCKKNVRIEVAPAGDGGSGGPGPSGAIHVSRVREEILPLEIESTTSLSTLARSLLKDLPEPPTKQRMPRTIQPVDDAHIADGQECSHLDILALVWRHDLVKGPGAEGRLIEVVDALHNAADELLNTAGGDFRLFLATGLATRDGQPAPDTNLPLNAVATIMDNYSDQRGFIIEALRREMGEGLILFPVGCPNRGRRPQQRDFRVRHDTNLADLNAATVKLFGHTLADLYYSPHAVVVAKPGDRVSPRLFSFSLSSQKFSGRPSQ